MTRMHRLVLLGSFLMSSWAAHAQSWVRVTPVPRHSGFLEMPPRLDSVTTTPAMRSVTDSQVDTLPMSTANAYHTVSEGNTLGAGTIATEADWYTKALAWMTGQSVTISTWGFKATEDVEKYITWIDDHIAPEVTMRTKQMAAFQRMLKAYQLYRQMELMTKSWHGSVFTFDVLNILPVFEQDTLDEFGVTNNGTRIGLTYKSDEPNSNILSEFGMGNPFIGPWSTPLLRTKAPFKFSDIGFDLEATPYSDTPTDSDLLSVGQQVNEQLDRVWFEGVMGGTVTNQGLYYSSKWADERPSPMLLKARAETARDARIAQILQEAQAQADAYHLPLMTVLDNYKDELAWWRAKPDEIYDNQMQRLDRLRNELQPVHNDVAKLEMSQKRAEDSDPEHKSFLDGLYNLYTQLGDSVGDVVNAASGNEDEGDNPGPRLLYKANTDYAKATHEAYLEALAIRRFLQARITADSQHGAAQSYYELYKQANARQAQLQKVKVAVDNYTTNADTIINTLQKFGLTPDDIHAQVRTLRAAAP